MKHVTAVLIMACMLTSCDTSRSSQDQRPELLLDAHKMNFDRFESMKVKYHELYELTNAYSRKELSTDDYNHLVSLIEWRNQLGDLIDADAESLRQTVKYLFDIYPEIHDDDTYSYTCRIKPLIRLTMILPPKP